MTCTVCGAHLNASAVACPACAAPVHTASASTGDTGDVPAAVRAGGATTSTSPPADAPRAVSDDPGPAGPPPAGPPPPPGGHGVPASTAPVAWQGQGQYGPAGAWSPPPHRSGLPGDVRGWAIGAHLAGLGAALLTVTIFGFVGPLVVWLLKRDDHPFVEHHAKEALNFQLTVLVAIGASVLLAVPAIIVGVLTLGLGLLLLAGLVLAAIVAWFVLPIVGAVKAADGHGYRYPFTIRFVR